MAGSNMALEKCPYGLVEDFPSHDNGVTMVFYLVLECSRIQHGIGSTLIPSSRWTTGSITREMGISIMNFFSLLIKIENYQK